MYRLAVVAVAVVATTQAAYSHEAACPRRPTRPSQRVPNNLSPQQTLPGWPTSTALSTRSDDIGLMFSRRHVDLSSSV